MTKISKNIIFVEFFFAYYHFIIYLRDIRRLNQFMLKLIKINIFKNWMRKYFNRIFFASNSIENIYSKQTSYQVFNVIREFEIVFLSIWEHNFPSFYLVQHSLSILMEERRDPNQHLINYNSQYPPIDSLIIFFVICKLWCIVSWLPL